MLIFIVLLASFSVAFGQEQCRTANGDAGSCILLEDCEPLVNINKIKKKTSNDLLFLRQSHCGLFMNIKPKVCCPTRNQWATFSTVKPFTFPPFDKPPSTATTSTTSGTSTTTSSSIITTSTEAPVTVDLLTLFATPAEEDDLTCKPSLNPPKPETFCCGVEAYSGDRIIGGKIAAADQFPWVALLEYNGTDRKTACGGTLISSRYVLTAAHCLGSTRWGYAYKVRLAEFNTSSYPIDMVEANGGGFEHVPNVFIPVETQIPHEGYVKNKQPVLDDIGLIKMTRNAPYNDFLRPICLPVKDVYATATIETYFWSAGWGSDGYKFSEVKQYIKLPTFTLEKCKSVYYHVNKPPVIYDTHICAGGEKDKDTCSGDSGGPLMYLAGDTWILAGVVSFGDMNCGTDGKPGVYTHVYKYMDWITKHIV